MAEKRRATTFRTSRGAIVYVEAPEIYFPPQITISQLKQGLREELDIHTTFQWERFLRDGLNAHFIGRTVDLNSTESFVEADDYWSQVGYQETGLATEFAGAFTLPKNLSRVAAYSIRAFEYAQFIVNSRLPTLRLLGNETEIHHYFGLEHGANFYNGLLCFSLTKTATVDNELHAFVGTSSGVADVNINIDRPADYTTALHVYRILLSKNLATFLIDDDPVLFVVLSGRSDPVKIKENVQPYSIVLAQSMPSSLTAFLEFWTNRTAAGSANLVSPVSPYRLRLSDGHEITPMQLPLYDEDTNTRFAGLVIAAGSETSHPVPVFGFNMRTFHFRADQAGDIDIEILTEAGNWRIYSPDATGHTEGTYTANELWSFVMTGDLVLARLTFTPDAYPCTVSDAEVVMR